MKQVFKGWWGEFKIKLVMFFFLGKGYRCFHNVTVKMQGYNTSQIDHIVVCKHGIFVIETKNYAGVITVNEESQYWTQTLGSRQFEFYSPIQQNEGHLGAMRWLLRSKEYPMANIVCFVGSAEFDSEPPFEVCFGGMGVIEMLKLYQQEVFSAEDVEDIAGKISKWRMPNTKKTQQIHIKNVKRKHGNKGGKANYKKNYYKRK